MNNTFLNEGLQETIFMSQLEAFHDSKHPKYICKLNNALYGLKQAL